jgi:O-antigen/teichoic acid export membrane protein
VNPLEETSTQAPSAARRVALNALNPFAAQVVTRVLMLGYVVVQYRVLGAQAEGVLGDYFLAGLVLMYTSTVAEWGLGTLLTREVARERDDTADVARRFRQTLSLRLGLAGLMALPVAVFVAVYLAFFGLSEAGAWAVAILTLSLVPSAVSGSVTAVLYAYERMSLPAVIGIGTAVLNVALGLLFVLTGWGVVGLALAALLSTVATAVVFWAILRRNYPEVASARPEQGLSRSTAMALLSDGWPLMLNALLVGLFFRVDQFIIKPVAGGLAVEQYNAAYSYLNFLLIITPAVTLALFPRMARHAVSDRRRLAYEYELALRVMLILSVPLVALTFWFAPLLVSIVTGGKEGYLPDSAVALRILIFFLPLSFVNGVTQYVLIALDRQRLITGVFAATVAFNLAVNLVLVPLMGIYGAAITTVLSEVVLLVPFLLYVGRETEPVRLWEVAWRPLLGGVLVAGVMWLTWGLTERWNASAADFGFYLGAGLLPLVLYAVAMVLVRPFTPDEIKAARRS